jgi:hypothetical protein
MWVWPVNRMPLSPGILWLTVNLAMIIQCLSRNNIIILQFYILRNNFFAYPRGYANPRFNTNGLRPSRPLVQCGRCMNPSAGLPTTGWCHTSSSCLHEAVLSSAHGHLNLILQALCKYRTQDQKRPCVAGQEIFQSFADTKKPKGRYGDEEAALL